MRRRRAFVSAVWVLGLVPMLLSGREAVADVVINEIMYAPLQGGELEYIELRNAGDTLVEISGWSLSGGIDWVFPAGTRLVAGEHIVVCRSRVAFERAYSTVPPSAIHGDWVGALSNGGEELVLRDAAASVVESVAWDDAAPWETLADGFGASLERLCAESDAQDPDNWRAGLVPRDDGEHGGSPAAPNRRTACPPAAPPRPPVRWSEIHYHPVGEESLVEIHEFVEIHNSGDEAVDLSAWRLAGGVDYEFPAGASIAPGEFLVIAKDPTSLAEVSTWALAPGDVLGGYERELDNGGERLAIIGAEGQGIDTMSYDDDAPWPIGADALGASSDWLDPALLPLESHRWMGRSLERVSFDAPASDPSNWVASPLDGCTPGRPNAGARETPLPIVVDRLVAPADGAGGLIRSSDDVRVQVAFGPTAPVGEVVIEWFVDDLEVVDEPVTTTTLHDDGVAGGDFVPGDGVYTALLASRPDDTIVRYRVLADRGSGLEPVSPRPSDPMAWHAYFVSPVIDTETRVYQLFITPERWGSLWSNIGGGRVSGCAPSSTWNERVPAVFVHEGEVIDAWVRYQGSRWNRRNGRDLSSWPYPGPTTPSPPKALSWRIALPRYAQVGGRSVLTLNKLTQGCPGLSAGVGYRLFGQADVPSPTTRFVRLHINGGYYHYMMEYERPGEDMMRRYHREQRELYPELPKEDVGHLFKSVGCTCDEGPFGWGDWRALGAYCGHAVDTRYAYTYDRKTHGWAGPEPIRELIEEFHVARSSGTAAVREFFEERFDVDLLLNYMVIINWAVPFDDMFQNHFAYQRRSDGRWLLMPWDLDQNFGGWKGASASVYMGEQGDPDNRSGWWHRLKDSFLASHRSEYEARMVELNNSILHPDNVLALVDEVLVEANPSEAAAAPAGIACSFSGAASSFRSFAVARHAVVDERLSSIRVDAGPDLTTFVGAEVTFDASASRPEPGPGVEYSWSNGMTGARPTTSFDTPGEFTITLTVSAEGQSLSDSVRVTVLEPPPEVFVEADGLVSIEAESFWINERHDADAAWWEEDDAIAGFAGEGYMAAMDTEYRKYSSDYASRAPELRYAIRFTQAGVYRVWIRGLSGSTAFDSCHVGLDGEARDESFATRFEVDADRFLWSGDTRGQGMQTVAVSVPGLHVLSIWIRESGQIVDKIVLTRDTGLVPTGDGPPESEVERPSTTPPFTRGDANGDRVLDLSDAVAIVLFLFRGDSALDCEDHGDVDDNGALQVTDAVRLLDHLFRAGPAPAAPYPERGLDTTPDEHDCGEG